jgi:extracellular elastinolytic metalloproteinase
MVAALAAVLTLSVVSVATASAEPAGVRATHARHTRSALFDSRVAGAPVSSDRQVLSARAALAQRLGSQGVVIADPQTGTLRMVGKLDGFLTGASSRSASLVATDYVRSNLRAFGLDQADMGTFHLRQDYVDIVGTHHLSWTQSAGGVTAFGNGLKANVTSDGRLINVTGSPVHNLRLASPLPHLGSLDAIGAARRSAGSDQLAPQRDDTAKLVLFSTQRGAKIAWQTTTWVDPNFLALSVVDAQTGNVLWRANLTHADAVGTGEAVDMYPSGDLPNGGGTVHAVTFPVFDGTSLAGNNAHVYSDVNDDDTDSPKDEVKAVTGTDWSGYMPQFDTTDTSQNCSTHFYCAWDKTVPKDWNRNRNWFGVQLYHFLNVYHDHLAAAPIGFTEAAGNFQVTNSTGQGLGGDPVEGQFIDGANTAKGFPDGSHVNNANFSTPPDGQPGIMQMYLQRKTPYWPTIPSGDSGNEAETVYHEFTHGLSNRLVTTPDGIPALNSQQSGSMGEGWSDWYAIDFTDDNGWFFDTPANGDAYPFRYSGGDEPVFRTSAADCPVGVAAPNCPTAESQVGPGGYTYADFGKIIGRPEVHTDGEIWVQTLWEMREELGSAVTESIVTRGMELSPPEPSFLDMRNAILQADEVVFGGSHQDVLWTLFAERGMGYYAAAADGNDVNPVADFETPPDCAVDPCGTVSGTITDSESGTPLQGVHVGLAGHLSGLGGDLGAVTGADGTFSIAAVPFHTYTFVVDQAGYEQPPNSNLVVDGNETIDRQTTRDWASIAGGAAIVHVSPPNYADFGCGPSGAFDLSLGTGWGSHVPGPRSIVVKLPIVIDVSSFGFDPGTACGDGPDTATKTFAIYTRRAGGAWVLAYSGHKKLKNGKLNKLIPSAASLGDVRFVKLVLLTNRGNPKYIDMSELSVRGT